MRMCLFMGAACALSFDPDSGSRFSSNPSYMSSLDHILIGRYCGKSHAEVAEADRSYCSWVIGARSLPRSLMPFKTWLKQTHGGVLPYGKYKNAFFSEILCEHPERQGRPWVGMDRFALSSISNIFSTLDRLSAKEMQNVRLLADHPVTCHMVLPVADGACLVRGLVRQSRQPQRRDARVPEVHAGPGGGGVDEGRRISETPGPEARTPIAAGAAGMCAGHILFGVPDLFRSSGGCAAAALQAFGDVFLLRSDE